MIDSLDFNYDTSPCHPQYTKNHSDILSYFFCLKTKAAFPD